MNLSVRSYPSVCVSVSISVVTSVSVCSDPSVCASVEHGLSPAFVGQEWPQTVVDGGGERSRLHAEVEQLQAGTVEPTVDWTKGGACWLLRQLQDNTNILDDHIIVHISGFHTRSKEVELLGVIC